MTTHLSQLWLILLLIAPLTLSQAAVFNFDEMPHATLLPNGYGGLNWENFWTYDYQELPGTGYEPAAVSLRNSVLNAWGHPAFISSSTSFDFISGYFTAAFNPELTLTVTAYSQGTVLVTDTFKLLTSSPTFRTFNFLGVDRLSFETSTMYPRSGSLHFALDNLTINNGYVPEPTTALFIGSGLIGLALIRRQRSQNLRFKD